MIPGPHPTHDNLPSPMNSRNAPPNACKQTQTSRARLRDWWLRFGAPLPLHMGTAAVTAFAQARLV